MPANRFLTQDCVFALGLESMLLRDPPHNPFSTASVNVAQYGKRSCSLDLSGSKTPTRLALSLNQVKLCPEIQSVEAPLRKAPQAEKELPPDAMRKRACDIKSRSANAVVVLM